MNTPGTSDLPARQRRAVGWLPMVVAAGLVVAGIGAVAAVAQLRSPAPSSSPAEIDTPADPLAALEQAVIERPDDARAWSQLGAAYVDHARVNSDPSAYPKAERALDRARELDPTWEALAATAALAAGRHDFGIALSFAEQARAVEPNSDFVLAIIVDALTELGRYTEAIDAAQAMVDLRPSLASYARVSYQRELHGDIDGAMDAMELARQASSAPGDIAFAEYYLGELEWQRGAFDDAAAHYTAAMKADPTAMQALAGLGKVAAARGDIAGAIERYEEAAEGFPDPEVLKELGELHLLAGDRERAEDAFERSHESNAAQAAGGVNVELEIALFSADHNRDLEAGLAAAQGEWGRRHSIHVADALAWQLFAHARYDEALRYADEALKLGTKSAAFHFHRAEIHGKLGNTELARADYDAAWSLNPYFSPLHHERLRTARTAS